MALVFLLTNDDGVHAEGLQALRLELENVRDAIVYVVAPDRERSASGHAITVHRPLLVDELELSGSRSRMWAVSGTPADCTKLAVMALLPETPSLVISGINRGPNLGTDVFYSGTVSAAIEGTILGIPSIAVSLGATEDLDYDLAAVFTRRLALRVIERGLPANTLLNVNIPALEESQIVGSAVTRLGVRRYRNVFHRRLDPRGRVYYWLAGEAMEEECEPDTDVTAIRNNLISITPIQLDLTHHGARAYLQRWSLDLLREPEGTCP